MFKVNHLKVILNETPVTWEWHYPIRSALWLTPILFICKIFYFIGIYPFVNVQLLLRIFTATLSAYAESKFLDFTYRMFQIFEISSNYFIFIILAPVANRPISQTNLGLPGRQTVNLEPVESIIFIHFPDQSRIRSNQPCSLWQFQHIKSKRKKESYSRMNFRRQLWTKWTPWSSDFSY